MQANYQIDQEMLAMTKLSLKEFLIEIAVHFYDIGRLSMGQARKLAGLDVISFQKEMAARNVYIKYDVEDLAQDLAAIEKYNKSKHDRSQ
jgi:predicted HTH domain antitoxin